MKFAEIGEKIDKGLEKTQEKTSKVTKNIKNKVYQYEEKTKINEIDKRIDNLANDLKKELVSKIEKENIAEFQNEKGYHEFINKIKDQPVIRNNIYKIRMLQYKKEAAKKKIDE